MSDAAYACGCAAGTDPEYELHAMASVAQVPESAGSRCALLDRPAPASLTRVPADVSVDEALKLITDAIQLRKTFELVQPNPKQGQECGAIRGVQCGDNLCGARGAAGSALRGHDPAGL